VVGKKKRELAAQQAQEAQQAHIERLAQFLDLARTFDGATQAEADSPIRLQAGERLFGTVETVALIEPRRAPGHYEGGSHGVSVRVPGTKSMRYRVGQTRGTFVPGAERPTPIDQGLFAITDKRAVFIGAKQTREWAWAKLIAVEHQADPPWTAIAVSNRQKTSGVSYPAGYADQLRFRLDLALSHFDGTTPNLVRELEAELASLAPPPAAADAPPAGPAPAPPAGPALPPPAGPAPAAPPPPPPGQWAPDPFGRHQQRWWDGCGWTDHVADDGVTSTDHAG
jgi:hypothetical protein